MLLKFDDVAKKQDLPTRDIDVPEWGGSVRIRHWTVAERNEFLRRIKSSQEEQDIGEWLIATLTVDEAGKPWCPAERVGELRQKNPRAIDAIAAAILTVVKVDGKKVEDAEKNS